MACWATIYTSSPGYTDDCRILTRPRWEVRRTSLGLNQWHLNMTGSHFVTTSCCLCSGFLDPVSRVRPFHLSPSRFDSGEAVAFNNFPLISAFRYWYLYWILLYIIFVGVTVKIFVSSNLCPGLSFCEMLCKYSDNRCIVLSSFYVCFGTSRHIIHLLIYM